jgi:4-hydroxybenzoate polyprenyltransferase
VCVDLDGTLIAGDLLWESFVELVKRRPLRALTVLATLWRGKAYFKQAVAREIDIDPASLPYRPEVLDELTAMRLGGSVLVLATASDQAPARVVANYLGIFSDVVASDGRTNMSAHRKSGALIDRYGEGGFDYFGNDDADVPVWRAAADATAVAASPALLKHVRRERSIRALGSHPRRLRSLVKALRPHQWVKNCLVFVPLVASHQILNANAWSASLLTAAVLSLCASAIYVLNDIVDIQSDRLHPRKRHRPFAAGELTVPSGICIAAALVTVATALGAATLPVGLGAIVGVYLIVTTLYSLRLKRQPVTDVFTLTGLYVLRIVAGGVATATVLSSWLLAFALFFFLSLAFVKRYAELVLTGGDLAGRGYGQQDALWIHAVGTSAGYMAVVVLALYVNAPEVTAMYSRPQVLGMLCPLLLFWITRLWFRAGRKVLHDDPVVEALKDPASYVAAAAGAAIMLAAI